MAKIFGIDGCPKGWLVLSVEQDSEHSPEAHIVTDLEDLASTLKPEDRIAIDMPIGLRDAEKKDHSRRECDRVVKQILGARACCVFYAPARGVLDHLTKHPEASAWHKRATGKGLSCQCFNILKKIKILDDWLRQHPQRTHQVFEVHPELSFAYWRCGGSKCEPIPNGKKTPEGRAERERLIEKIWPSAVQAAKEALGAKSSGASTLWQDDDLLDAFAALWSMQRVVKKTAVPHPARPEKDSRGLSMCVWA